MVEEKRCTSCDSTMRKTDITTEGVGDLYIETDRDGGVLDMLDVSNHVDIRAFVCTDCGLTQLYAEDIVEDNKEE